MLLKAFAISVLIVCAFTLVAYHVPPYSWLDTVYIFSLYTGLILGLLIHGAHGGTSAQEIIGLILGLLVNVAAYAILIGMFLVIRDRAKRPR
jgi:hypothetical protein